MRNTLIRARGNRTQTEVSSEMGISQKYLSKLELGQRTPSIKIAVKIANYYNTSIDYLFPDIFLIEKSPNSSIN
jgi:putative transcriptional regulator